MNSKIRGTCAVAVALLGLMASAPQAFAQQGGLGWFIFENRNLLDIPAVFAGQLTVIVIGLIVESLIFRTTERNTVQKWGIPVLVRGMG